jgi:hypothetical protein
MTSVSPKRYDGLPEQRFTAALRGRVNPTLIPDAVIKQIRNAAFAALY